MPRILRRPQAYQDILDVLEHIGEEAPNSASAWLDRLENTLNTLSNQPLIGPPRPELWDGLRFHPFGNYNIYYFDISDGIDIVRLLHSSQDITPNVLNPHQLR